MDEKNIVEVKTKKTIDDKHKNLIIAISVALIILILVAIPTIIVLLNDDGGSTDDPIGDGIGNDDIDPDNYTDTDEIITGTYSLNINGSGVAGSAAYAFNGNTVIHTYTDDGELITVEYTYVIAKNGRGDKIIKFTEVGTDEMKYHDFYDGVYIDKTPFISINESWYYLQSES